MINSHLYIYSFFEFLFSFSIQLLKHFPRSKTNPDYIPFGYFVTVVQWFEMANNEDKLRAIFLYVNNGDPIDAVMISKLLKHIYRETREVFLFH